MQQKIIMSANAMAVLYKPATATRLMVSRSRSSIDSQVLKSDDNSCNKLQNNKKMFLNLSSSYAQGLWNYSKWMFYVLCYKNLFI